MIKVYVQVGQDFNQILAYSTMKQEYTNVEVVQDDKYVDVTKLQGYVAYQGSDGLNHLKFSQEQYDKYLEKKRKHEEHQNAIELYNELLNQTVLQNATDEQALIMKHLYPEWEPEVQYEVDDRVKNNGNLYKCKQAHKSEMGVNRTPDLLPALWDLITPDDPSVGTKENPINVPEPFSSMEYEYGKYYKEGADVYLMNRSGMKVGDRISLTYKPSQLIGHYFAKI